MTPQQEQLKVWQETCIEYINMASTYAELEKIGFEIADGKKLIGAVRDDMTLIKSAYVRKQRELKNAEGDKHELSDAT
jgi:hypothetical protein